jgi:hypothetical protein
MNVFHYDRQGLPIEWREWCRLFALPDVYRRVARTDFPTGTVVSTVWIGLNHNYGDGPPLIFETMIFTEAGGDDLGCWRYATEAEAIEGHERVVAEVQARMDAIAAVTGAGER